jgi:hypothetical protein
MSVARFSRTPGTPYWPAAAERGSSASSNPLPSSCTRNRGPRRALAPIALPGCVLFMSIASAPMLDKLDQSRAIFTHCS